MDLMGMGGFMQGAGQIMGALGIGNKGTSRKREYDSYVLQSRASREDIPLRVKAFRDAGIHPLFGMGSQPFTPSPSGASDGGGFDPAQLGQGIGRAVSAYTSKPERELAAKRDALTLDNMQAQNDLLRAQTTSIHLQNRPPAVPSGVLPMAGQGDSLVGFDKNLSSDASLTATRNGEFAVVPSKSVKENIEDMTIPEAQWYTRQTVAEPPAGYAYNPFTGVLFPLEQKSFQGKVARTWRKVRKGAIWNDPYWNN